MACATDPAAQAETTLTKSFAGTPLAVLSLVCVLGGCASAQDARDEVVDAAAAPSAAAISAAITWSIQEGSSGGKISAGGLYTAPATTGTFHVVATLQSDPTKSASAAVTVEVPVVAVAISPRSVAVAPLGTQTFTCKVTNAADTSCTWKVQEGAGGAVDASGRYTAPAAAGTYHVVSTSSADPSKSDVATVTVAAAPPTGTWVNVTPSNASLDMSYGGGGNYGVQTVAVDPRRPSDLYAQFNNQGIWKSTDYGRTWTGPVNTGTNGSGMTGAGGLSLADGGAGKPPILHVANIRGGVGYWRSLDGGVSWTRYDVAPGGSRQDFYPPTVDPYDPSHLLMCGHEMDLLVESTDGGQTWKQVPMNSGMNSGGGTSFLFFVNTGSATTTRNTWLLISQQNVGTWRTANAGQTWTKVDDNTHPHGSSQIYQPGTDGVVFMAGVYSSLGWGVLRSTDYGQTWTHYGSSAGETIVFGTSKAVYAMYGWAQGPGNVAPALQVAPQPGATGWTSPPTPAAMTQGPGQAAVTVQGSNNVIVTASWLAGLWRYVEN